MPVTFATRTWYSEYVVTDEDVAKQVDAARRERVGSHGISKAVVRSSVLCDRFSSGGLGTDCSFCLQDSEAISVSRNRPDAINIMFTWLQRRQYLVGYRSMTAMHPRSG